MNKKDLQKERISLFRDASNFKHVDRIPHLGCVVTWKILAAGYTLTEAMTDFDILEKSVRYFLDKYLSYPEGYKKLVGDMLPFYLKSAKKMLMRLLLVILRDG